MLPTPKTIHEEAIKVGKGILREAAARRITEDQIDQMAVGMVIDYFGLAIYMPKQDPTPPPLYDVFKKLPSSEQAQRTDHDAIKCRAYEYHLHKVKVENKSCVHSLQSWVIPALERMGDQDRVAECRRILREHEIATNTAVMDWDELEARYR